MAILSRQANKTVELFEVPDDKLDAYRLPTITAQKEPVDRELFDLYRMEYERSALRYDDLYKAAWTNFSYIALIAGAILTFGSESFMTELSIFLATIPLLFWWIATFEPLNRYGDQVQTRAACIEKLLNELVGLAPAERECQRGLRHFQEFEERHFTIQWAKLLIIVLFWAVLHLIVLQSFFGLSKYIVWICMPLGVVLLLTWLVWQYRDAPKRLGHILRVRFIVRTFAGAITIVALCSAYGAHQRHQPPRSENYIKSGSAKSDPKLPERLNIKIEK